MTLPALSIHEITENSADPVILCRPDGILLFLNKAAERLYSAKAKPSQLSQLFENEVAEKILACTHFTCLQAALRTSLPFSISYSCLVGKLGSGDPDEEYLMLILKPFDFNFVDKSEQEHNLAAVCHDLKNPLGALFGYADALIETQLGLNLNDKQKEIVRRIRSTAVRSIELVRNLQNLSGLKNISAYSLHKQYDLNRIVSAVYSGTWREEPEKPKISVKLSETPLLTKVESILIDRVITNLYANALKFTPQDGIIEISTYKEGHYVCFEIRNNLPLIDKKELSSIFLSRYRAAGSKGTAGSGLGLYIAKEICEKVGADISAESSAETGTVFKVKFPA